MCDSIFAQKGIKLLIPKMRATFTNNSKRESKSAKDVALDKFNHNFMVIKCEWPLLRSISKRSQLPLECIRIRMKMEKDQ